MFSFLLAFLLIGAFGIDVPSSSIATFAMITSSNWTNATAIPTIPTFVRDFRNTTRTPSAFSNSTLSVQPSVSTSTNPVAALNTTCSTWRSPSRPNAPIVNPDADTPPMEVTSVLPPTTSSSTTSQAMTPHTVYVTVDNGCAVHNTPPQPSPVESHSSVNQSVSVPVSPGVTTVWPQPAAGGHGHPIVDNPDAGGQTADMQPTSTQPMSTLSTSTPPTSTESSSTTSESTQSTSTSVISTTSIPAYSDQQLPHTITRPTTTPTVTVKVYPIDK